MSAGPGSVDHLTGGAEELHAFLVLVVGESAGEEGFIVTVYVGALAKFTMFVFFKHRLQAAIGDDEPGVNQAVEHVGVVLNELLVLLRVLLVFVYVANEI